jgi:hypothetical protein
MRIFRSWLVWAALCSACATLQSGGDGGPYGPKAKRSDNGKVFYNPHGLKEIVDARIKARLARRPVTSRPMALSFAALVIQNRWFPPS